MSESASLEHILTLRDQMLRDMANRRNYEQLVHSAMWAGIGIATGFAKSEDIHLTIFPYYILMAFSCLFYAGWVAFISMRQLQNFDETRALRRIIYSGSDVLNPLKEHVKEMNWKQILWQWLKAIIDPPAFLRIGVNIILLVLCGWILR